MLNGASDDVISPTDLDVREMALVEDEAAVRGPIVEVLGEFGYRALQGPDGPKGLESCNPTAASTCSSPTSACPASTAVRSPMPRACCGSI